MIETKLSVKEIESIIVAYLGGVRTNIIVPNLSWGFLNHEADLIAVDKNGYLKGPEYATGIGLLMESLRIKERPSHQVQEEPIKTEGQYIRENEGNFYIFRDSYK